jgi:hypothetical protein
MALSQPATFDETWSDERVASYLSRQPVTGENADFHVLMTAYKHMRAADFQRLLIMFKAAGRDVQARNQQGRSLLEIVREHPQSEDFVKLLSDLT